MFLIDWLKNLFNNLLKVFKAFVNEAFSYTSKLLLAEFKEFAIQVVNQLEGTDLTDDEKRDEAIEQIKAEAKARGKELKDHLVRWLVETAVAYMKENID